MALHTPGRDRRVMHGAVEREVELHVPFEAVEVAGDADGRVGDVVRDRVPVSRRSLRIRAIRPELGQGPREVATTDAVGRIRLPGGRVAAVPLSVVRPERIGASSAGADVDRGAVGRIEPAAVADHVDRHPLVCLVSELRRRGPGRAAIPAADSGSANPFTCPQCGPTNRWTRLGIGTPFCAICVSRASGCQRFGSCRVAPGFLTTSGWLTGLYSVST